MGSELKNVFSQEKAISKGDYMYSLFMKWSAFISVKPTTLKSYRSGILRFIRYCQERGIKKPSRADALKYRDCLASRLKASSVRVYLVALRSLYQFASSELGCEDITTRIKAPKISTSQGFSKDYLTAEQCRDLLHTTDGGGLYNLRNKAIFSLMITTGLRCCEIVRANIDDLCTKGGGPALVIQGKGRDAKDAWVKLAPPVEKAIRAYLVARGGAPANAPLFAGVGNRSGKNGRLLASSISRLCKLAFRQMGLISGRITGHSLRHTTATLNLLNGGTLEETQNLLRHSSINTTTIYIHALTRVNNNSEIRVASAVFS